MFKERLETEMLLYDEIVKKKNSKSDYYNGILEHYQNPVLTRAHIPVFWKFDFNEKTNPFFMERMGVNAVFNSGALFLNGKYYLVPRIEGVDRKSFFAVASSNSPIDGFRLFDYPIELEELSDNETNHYDMRLTKHEDGYIYGVFCVESKDPNAPPNDLSSAIAKAGIIRTTDLHTWERLPNLVTNSPQQRNAILHPEFVNGQYAFYTRPQDDFISTGSGGGICIGFCDNIENPVIEEEFLLSKRRYHTITEYKNGGGAVPIKTPVGFIHIAHGVRATAAGLRYVIYAFATALDDPTRIIAEPGGYLIAPFGEERVGDVSNVVFTNGAIVDNEDDVYIYYASSDTRLHVAKTSIERLIDYTFNTKSDPCRTTLCVKQRVELIRKNMEYMKNTKI